MKKALLFSTLTAALILTIGAFAPLEKILTDELEIGAKAPMTDVEVKDVSGEMVTLEEVAGDNGLLVIFSCNTCPSFRNSSF